MSNGRKIWRYGFGAKMETLYFHNEKHSTETLFVSRVKWENGTKKSPWSSIFIFHWWTEPEFPFLVNCVSYSNNP